MKRILRLISLVLILALCFSSCDFGKKDEPVSLDGKKVLFIGNSFTFYGHVVIEKSTTTFELDERDNDHGYFYQICKSNGQEPYVVNWTFGGHSLHDLFSGTCNADRGCDGVDHLSYLTDLAYDYVHISGGGGLANQETFIEDMARVTSIFREANPDVKIIFAPSTSVYTVNGDTVDTYKLREESAIIDHLDALRDDGIIIADWGKMLVDIMEGTTEVPGATQEYTKTSFIVARTADDGYHPNQLTGYLTALMAYCVMTGESAVGQSYAFCNDRTIHKKFDFYEFQFNKYKKASTNYIRIFHTESDMLGLQQVIDEYIKAEKERCK